MPAASPGGSGGWAAIAGDETGRLYGLVRARAGLPWHVLVADVSPDALSSRDAQEAAVPLRDLAASQVVLTSPPITFDVASAAASPDGHSLLLVGTSRDADGEAGVPVLALVDLYGSQPASGSSAGGAAALAAAYPGAKQRLAALFTVHAGFYGERPGLRILQASWHPGSRTHFAALASDSRWRLYHTSNLAEAEQTCWLKLPGGPQASSLGLAHRGGGGGAAAAPPRVTAFAFGPQPGGGGGGGSAGGWASFAVLFLASDGGVYALCPVAPFGARVGAALLQRLLDASSSTGHTWLLAAFLSLLSHESAVVSARPHVLETAAPALQGPLNLGTESLRPRALRSVACTLAVSGAAAGAEQPGPGFSVLATGFSSGSVYAHALELGQVLPVWVDATPQVAYDHRGDVAAVRYECDTVPTRPPDAPDAGSLEPDAGGALLSPLLLLDALKLNLHLPPGSAGSEALGGDEDDGDADGQGSGGLLNPADSDEESDAGYDPAGPRRSSAAARRGSAGLGGSSGPSLAGRFAAAAGGVGDSSSGDEADEGEEALLAQLARVTLHAAPELPGRFWAVHDQGAWGVNVRWLGHLTGQLAEGLQQSLPAPALQELLLSASGVLSSAVVGNALLGSGCVVLERSVAAAAAAAGQQQLQPAQAAALAQQQQQRPLLTFLRPRPTGVLAEGVVGAPEQGLDDSLAGEGMASLAELQLTPEELSAQSRMEEFYADICRGPRRLPPPAKPPNLAQLPPGDPTSLQYLQDATNWLVDTHVQFANGAHADLSKRAAQLQDEVSEQGSALAALQQLAAAAVERQAALAARLDRLGQVASTLSERASLLASLHWSVPRQLSRAEAQLGKQLEFWEQRRDQLKVSWRALRGRLDSYSAAAAADADAKAPHVHAASGAATPDGPGRFPRGVAGLAAGRVKGRTQVTRPSPGPVAAAQLARLKEQLAQQHHVISDARERLAGLSAELDAFRLEHPDLQLPARLARLGPAV